MHTQTLSQKGHQPLVSRYSVRTGVGISSEANLASKLSHESSSIVPLLSVEASATVVESVGELLVAIEGRILRVTHPISKPPPRIRVLNGEGEFWNPSTWLLTADNNAVGSDSIIEALYFIGGLHLSKEK